MAVGQLYHHVAPSNEVGIVVKPLIRLLKHHTEVQAIVLGNIATMSADRSVSVAIVYYLIMHISGFRFYRFIIMLSFLLVLMHIYSSSEYV